LPPFTAPHIRIRATGRLESTRECLHFCGAVDTAGHRSDRCRHTAFRWCDFVASASIVLERGTDFLCQRGCSSLCPLNMILLTRPPSGMKAPTGCPGNKPRLTGCDRRRSRRSSEARKRELFHTRLGFLSLASAACPSPCFAFVESVPPQLPFSGRS
jgi:hypothetical protein